MARLTTPRCMWFRLRLPVNRDAPSFGALELNRERWTAPPGAFRGEGVSPTRRTARSLGLRAFNPNKSALRRYGGRDALPPESEPRWD